jgi:glycerophosphoryl diester phosphodiesterase
MKPLLIAHRGGAQRRDREENRPATCRRSLAFGVDAVECDVRLSADNEVVVIHDDTLNRTTPGHGHVSAFTAKELAAFGVPTLRELCRLVRGKARLLVEIKSASPYRVMDVLTEERMEREALVISFHPEYLRPIARLRPDFELGLLLYEFGGDVPTLARYIELGRELRATTLGPNLRLCSRRLVAAVHDAGMRVIAWTANTKRAQRALIRVGVDGIVTDHPERLKTLL